MPLIIGEERLIPGFEEHLVGLTVGDTTEFDITFPEDYAEETLAGQAGALQRRVARAAREGRCPPLDDDFARQFGNYEDLAELRDEIRPRLERNAIDKARHEFAERIIDYAVANATIELPEILVEQETEVMHDEFRATLARQGVTEQAYMKATNQTEDDLHNEFRPRAEERVKVLLVISKIADAEGIDGRRRRRRGRARPRAGALLRQPAAHEVLRVGARPQLHQEHAAAEPDGREADRRLARGPPGASAAAARRGRTTGAVDALGGRMPTAAIGATDPGVDRRRRRPGRRDPTDETAPANPPTAPASRHPASTQEFQEFQPCSCRW